MPQPSLSASPVPKFASFRPAKPSAHQKHQEDVDGKARSCYPSHDKISAFVDRRGVLNDLCEDLTIKGARQLHGLGLVASHVSFRDLPKNFSVDETGDKDNLRYESLHRGDISRYRRFGYGNVLGSSGKIKINTSTDTALVLREAEQPVSSRDKRIFAKVAVVEELRLRPELINVSLNDSELVADFILLDNRAARMRKRLGDANDSDCSDEEQSDVDYRSIHGKAKADSGIDPDLELNSPSKDSDDASSRELLKERSRFHRTTHDDPKNGKAWLDLLSAFQPKEADGVVTAFEQRRNADEKLSIYAQALKHVTDPHYLQQLLVGKMEVGALVWESAKLRREWERVLVEHPFFTKLWVARFDSERHKQQDFHLESFMKIAERCMSGLRKCAERDLEQAESSPRSSTALQLSVLTCITKLLVEAGYSERATGIWQANLEFNVNRPNSFHMKPMTEMLQSFEDFWDSEVPRFGEQNAKGWANFFEHRSESPPPREVIATQPPTDLLSWIRSERYVAHNPKLPARASDDVPNEGIHSVVLFSDLEGYLVHLSEASTDLLVAAFLNFCGLPPLPVLESSPEHWLTNSISITNRFHAFNEIGEATLPSVVDSQMPLCVNNPFSYPFSHFIPTADTLLADSSSWFSAFHHLNNFGKRLGGGDQWIHRSLRTIAEANVGGDRLKTYFLAFEAQFLSSAVRKTAKAFLKRSPQNLALYAVLGVSELWSGRFQSGDSIFASAIKMATELKGKERRKRLLLWRSWIWEYVKVGKYTEAAQRTQLLTQSDSAVGELKLQPSDTAGVEQAAFIFLEEKYDSLRHHDIVNAVHSIECHALCSVLLGQNLQDCLEIYATSLDMTGHDHNLSKEGKDLYLEMLHQSRSKLVYHYATHVQSTRPALIREILLQSIHAFPDNTIFLATYLWSERRFQIDDRVRSIVPMLQYSSSGDDDGVSITVHQFAVYSELTRSVLLGSSANSIRTAFERAIVNQAASTSPVLWKLYLLYEVERGSRTRAKHIFFRAIRAYPWVKELYLLAFEHLNENFATQERSALYEMMLDRGIRTLEMPKQTLEMQ